MTKRAKIRLMFLGAGVLLLIGVVAIQLPAIASGLILHPLRRHVGVALQTAAVDPRITAVVAAEVFSDLRTVVKERAPFFISAGNVGKAIQLAERKGGFQMEAVSPELAARMIKVPVLLIHGADDTDTVPDHSRRVFVGLGGPKRLILVPGAKHNQSLHGAVWEDIERWVDTVVGHSPDAQTDTPKQ